MREQTETSNDKNTPERLLREMKRIRMIEEEIARRYPEQQMRCPVHLSVGQEAAAVGICSALRETDWAFSGHRNHAHYIAKGGDLNAMIAEIYGKSTGCCGGKGGSMHLTDKAAGFIGATPIVGSTIPIAVGAALTAKKEGLGRVVVAFLGDGAMEAGVVHESLNFAELKQLPILFACENNLYSVYSPMNVRQPKKRTIASLAKGHGITTESVDGNNVKKINKLAMQMISKMRAGEGPAFIEMATYRWLEHCGPGYDNNIGYRTEEEFKEWKKRDPILMISRTENIELEKEETVKIREEIDEAFFKAINDPFPKADDAANNLFSPTEKLVTIEEGEDERQITYAEAIREAQEAGLKEDKNCYLMGLGVPDPKGIFGTTTGLQEIYGEERVFDIPLSENALTGVAIGSAITGMRPILTHQRVDFTLVSIDQIVNQAAKWHYMFNGTMKVPLVIRMIIGRGWGQGPQHSQSLHAWFAHIPGLKVIMPSSPYDAKGMLIEAIRDENPVLVIEHRWLHNIKGYVPRGSYGVSLENARVVSMGKDVTIVSTSYMTVEAIKASKRLITSGITTEVIDLKSISTIDMKTIEKSLKKTKRLVIVDQAEKTCGISAEIITRVIENESIELIAKPIRICLPNHPVPTSPYLSKDYYPTSETISKRICALMNKKERWIDEQKEDTFRDQPDKKFNGPF
mgnify:CR=1 FL=1